MLFVKPNPARHSASLPLHVFFTYGLLGPVPFFLAALELKRIDDHQREFTFRSEIKRWKFEVVLCYFFATAVTLSGLLILAMPNSDKTANYSLFLPSSFVFSVLTLSQLGIWIALGGPGRLWRKLKKWLKSKMPQRQRHPVPRPATQGT
jgi:hypothetical protein